MRTLDVLTLLLCFYLRTASKAKAEKKDPSSDEAKANPFLSTYFNPPLGGWTIIDFESKIWDKPEEKARISRENYKDFVERRFEELKQEGKGVPTNETEARSLATSAINAIVKNAKVEGSVRFLLEQFIKKGDTPNLDCDLFSYVCGDLLGKFGFNASLVAVGMHAFLHLYRKGVADFYIDTDNRDAGMKGVLWGATQGNSGYSPWLFTAGDIRLRYPRIIEERKFGKLGALDYAMRAQDFFNRNRDYKSAMADLDKGMKMRPDIPELVILKTFMTINSDRKNTGATLNLLGRMIDDNAENTPQGALALHARARANFVLGNYQDALNDAKSAQERLPSNYVKLNGLILAISMMMNGNSIGVAIVEDMIKKDPKFMEGYFYVAYGMAKNPYYFSIGDQEQIYSAAYALPLAEKYVAGNGKDSAGFNLLGIIHLRLEKPDKAKADFERAIELAPGFSGTYFNLAETYRLKGEYENAITAISQAIDLNKKDSGYLVLRANLYHAIGKERKAMEDWESAAKLKTVQSLEYRFLVPSPI